jgi:hypothetical protein
MKFAGVPNVRHGAAEWLTEKEQATGSEDEAARRIPARDVNMITLAKTLLRHQS